MSIKLTGVRSLQNKLERMAFDLVCDAERVLRETPDRVEVVDRLLEAARVLRVASRSC